MPADAVTDSKITGGKLSSGIVFQPQPTSTPGPENPNPTATPVPQPTATPNPEDPGGGDGGDDEDQNDDDEELIDPDDESFDGNDIFLPFITIGSAAVGGAASLGFVFLSFRQSGE